MDSVMKLVVPHTGEFQASDARLIRLAEFLGISHVGLLLDKATRSYAEYFERALPDYRCCLVVNPRVLREWAAGAVPPVALAQCLISRVGHLLVHGLEKDAFCKDLIRALSGDRLCGVQPIADTGQLYEIDSDSRDVCGAFAGLSCGPANRDNDLILPLKAESADVRTPISIAGSPFMALIKRGKTE